MVSRILVVALTAAAGLAQTPRPAERERIGVVTGTDVYVRSGPGDSYPCGKLSYPARVRVVGQWHGWLKIVPPKGYYSLISKDYVRAVGNVGTVAAANVLVRAGSDLQPARMDAIQTKLDTGAKVAIIGERGGYYKIVPPPGAYLWISTRYVKPISADTPPATAPAVATRPTTTRPVVVTTRPAEVKNQLAAFEAAEKALRAEFKKPRETRNLSALLARYKAIAPADDSPLAPYVEARLKFLQSEMELAKDLQEVAQLVRDAEATQAKLAADRQRFEVTVPTRRPSAAYATEGVLVASELFTGGPTAPKRYIVRDPDTHLISAYVQCTSGVVDLSKHVGARVGVIGESTYDEGLRLYVVEAEQIVVLRAVPTPAVTPTPRPVPAPTTKPAPKPAPAPATRPAPKPAPAPTTRPAPKPAPRTRPAEKPLPTTGLPVIKPTTTRPADDAEINPEEYE